MVEGGSFNNRRLSQLSQAEDDPTPPQQRRPAFLRILTPRSSDSVLTKSQKNLIPALGDSFHSASSTAVSDDTSTDNVSDGTPPVSPDNLKPRRLSASDPHHPVLRAAEEEEDKLDEAERLLRGVLASEEETYGVTHPATQATVRNLAILLIHRHKYDEAEKLLVAQTLDTVVLTREEAPIETLFRF